MCWLFYPVGTFLIFSKFIIRIMWIFIVLQQKCAIFSQYSQDCNENEMTWKLFVHLVGLFSPVHLGNVDSLINVMENFSKISKHAASLLVSLECLINCIIFNCFENYCTVIFQNFLIYESRVFMCLIFKMYILNVIF